MSDGIICLDTSVLIKYLTPDEQDEAATRLVVGAILDGSRLVAPAWAWAEIGSVLRKKLRLGLLMPDEATDLWNAYLKLPIEYVQDSRISARAWELAQQYQLPTLYDAAFLACTEILSAGDAARREFWTADAVLLRHLGQSIPDYVKRL